MSCLFCNIVDKKIPAKVAYEDENILAFHDIQPQAPTHILIIPKKHVQNILEFDANDATLLGNLLKAVQHLVKEYQLESKGFRIVTNTGEEGGQSVFHLHFHLLGGRSLTWPPG